MIERQTINGGEATVSYFGDDFKPTTKESAPNAKVVFDDGEILFLTSNKPAAPEKSQPKKIETPPDDKPKRVADLTKRKTDLEAELARIDAELGKLTQATDPPDVRAQVRIWQRALLGLDHTEVDMRDLMERGLAEVAGLPHVKLRDIHAATDEVMRGVTKLRTDAIKRLFRGLRQKLGAINIGGQSLAAWAQSITHADLQGI